LHGQKKAFTLPQPTREGEMAMAKRTKAKVTRKRAATQAPEQRLMVVPSEQPRPSAHEVHGRGSVFKIATTTAAGAPRTLNVFPDMPDMRDRYYEPTLQVLQPRLHPPLGVPVRDQGIEGACTGFGLATVIDVLNASRARLFPKLPAQVSSRMLYEMARLHDEWPGINYEGSSVRGAIKGFYHNGVCSEACAPYVPGPAKWTLTIEAAKEARGMRLGAYYRLRRSITDFHAALNEVGAVFASAQVHDGWSKTTGQAAIAPGTHKTGGHAFAIVGYDEEGFFVQNSWGPGWGQGGIARWAYEDWAETLVDAWVLQLSLPTPNIFTLQRTALTGPRAIARPTTDARRGQIIGHFINIDDGVIQETGKYATPFTSVQETAKRLAEETEKPAAETKYDHLVVYGHGGLNSVDAEAARIDHMKPGFKRNRVYNYHLMWGTSAFEVLWDSLIGAGRRRDERMGSLITDLTDEVFEGVVGGVGTRIWTQIKDDAKTSFSGGGGGTKGLRPILEAASGGARPLAIHLVAHSAGAIIMGRLIERMATTLKAPLTLASVHLMAPACTTDLFNELYAPFVGAKKGNMKIDKLFIYNLSDERELDDVVGPELVGTTIPLYFKSLLYLVSNAFEPQPEESLAGMQISEGFLKPGAKIEHAGVDKTTTSKTHGGFDNDALTMNTILERMLGKKPVEPFKSEELMGF
jgi:Papain family cysteine protease